MDHPDPVPASVEAPAPERPSDFFVPVQEPVSRIAIRWIPHETAGAHTLVLPVMHMGVIHHNEDEEMVIIECQSFLITFDFAERHQIAARWDQHQAALRESKPGEADSNSESPKFQNAHDFVVQLQREVISEVHALGDEALGILVKRMNPAGALEVYPPLPAELSPPASYEDEDEDREGGPDEADLAASSAEAFPEGT